MSPIPRRRPTDSKLAFKTRRGESRPGLSYEIEERTQESSPFHIALARAFAQRGMTLECFCPAGDALARRVLEEYGAMFIAEGVSLPPVCVFETKEEVESFQREAGWRGAEF